MPYFDPEVMGASIANDMNSVEALLFGRRTWQTMAAACNVETAQRTAPHTASAIPVCPGGAGVYEALIT